MSFQSIAVVVFLSGLVGTVSKGGGSTLRVRDAYGTEYRLGDTVLESDRLYIECEALDKSSGNPSHIHKPTFVIEGDKVKTYYHEYPTYTWMGCQYVVGHGVQIVNISVKHVGHQPGCTAYFYVKQMYVQHPSDISIAPGEPGEFTCIVSEPGSIQWEQLYPGGSDLVIAIDNKSYYREFRVTKNGAVSTLSILSATNEMDGDQFACRYESLVISKPASLHVTDVFENPKAIIQLHDATEIRETTTTARKSTTITVRSTEENIRNDENENPALKHESGRYDGQKQPNSSPLPSSATACTDVSVIYYALLFLRVTMLI